jgi:FMNH2-dependent dimethyl sulfone monooxygenase
MKWATWGSNVSGGFLRAKVEQQTEWSLEYNKKLAILADELGVDAILFPTRYLGRLGGDGDGGGQLDPLTVTAAIAGVTKRIHLLSAVLPGFVHPVTLAKIGATIDHISNGRWHVNLVSGWFQKEQETFGLDWIDHSERYKRSEEYIEVLKGLWQEEEFTFHGRYYNVEKGKLRPFPIQKPYPPIFQGGNSAEARQMAGRLSDWYFMNGAPLEELSEQIEDVTRIAKTYDRRVRFAVNAFVIARETEEAAQDELEAIIERADQSAIEQFQQHAKGAKGMWSKASKLSDFVATNEGFRTGLIGSYQQVAEKVRQLEEIGIDLILLAFRDPIKELPIFFEEVVPLTRFQSTLNK